ncbi:MAG: Hpt domain-containing protein [Hyphomonadaceae bacterium]|nr:Hpt domain-containing protein [Hyphomonadaceae bacterium]
MTKPAAQFVDPRDAGLRGLALSRPVFDAKAVERAEDALTALAESMEAWFDRDIDKLQSARLALEEAPDSASRLEAFLIVAHDLRGMGATYGYPLVSELAHSLCRLIEATPQPPPPPRMALIASHVDAIRAAARAGLKDASTPLGDALLAELRARVAKFATPES